MEKIDVVTFAPRMPETPEAMEKREQWNRFVRASNNGTVFHQAAFLDYHASGRFAFEHLLFYRAGELLAVLPGAPSGTTYRSPMGASFGSFVFPTFATLADADAVVKAFLAWCRGRGIAEALLTPPMQIYHEVMDESYEYALLYNGFTLSHCLYSSIIDLARVRGKEDLSKNTRHKINKAANKGVRIEESRDFAAFYPILLENKAKFGVKPTHTLEELLRIEELLPGMMTLFLAYVGEEPVAGELLFAANSRCVINFYTMHRYEYRNYFAVNALVEHALRWSVARGFRYYDYGVSQDTAHANPLEPSWPLVLFKESMGSTGCARKTFRIRL